MQEFYERIATVFREHKTEMVTVAVVAFLAGAIIF